MPLWEDVFTWYRVKDVVIGIHDIAVHELELHAWLLYKMLEQVVLSVGFDVWIYSDD
jgi:hypothetical protein